MKLLSVRVARGGEVLAPGRPERPVQFIDARDLAEWLVAMAGFMLINVDKAVAAGLRIRPVGDTIRETLTWARTELSNTSLKAGVDIERKQALLRKWHQSSQP